MPGIFMQRTYGGVRMKTIKQVKIFIKDIPANQISSARVDLKPRPIKIREFSDLSAIPATFDEPERESFFN